MFELAQAKRRRWPAFCLGLGLGVLGATVLLAYGLTDTLEFAQRLEEAVAVGERAGLDIIVYRKDDRLHVKARDNQCWPKRRPGGFGA